MQSNIAIIYNNIKLSSPHRSPRGYNRYKNGAMGGASPASNPQATWPPLPSISGASMNTPRRHADFHVFFTSLSAEERASWSRSRRQVKVGSVIISTAASDFLSSCLMGRGSPLVSALSRPHQLVGGKRLILILLPLTGTPVPWVLSSSRSPSSSASIVFLRHFRSPSAGRYRPVRRQPLPSASLFVLCRCAIRYIYI